MRVPPLRSPSFKLKKTGHVVFSPAGRYLAQVTTRVLVWDTVSRTVAAQYKVIKNESHLCFSPAGDVLAVKNTNGEIVFCAPASGTVISSTGGFPYRREGGRPVFSSNGQQLMDGDWNGVLRLISVEDSREIVAKDFGRGYMFGSIDSSVDSRTTVAALNAKSGTTGGSKLLLYLDGQSFDSPIEVRPNDPLLSVEGGWRWIDAMALHPTGKMLALGLSGRTPSEPNLMALVSLDGSLIGCVETPSRQHAIQGLAWSRLGAVCWTVHENTWRTGMTNSDRRALQQEVTHDSIYLYSGSDLRPLAQWAWDGARGVAFSPDGTALAIGSTGRAGAYYAEARA